MAEFFSCDNKNISLEQAIRDMIYNDGNNNPVININPQGSNLEPFFTCNNNPPLELVLRALIIKDENDRPIFNIAQS